MDAPPLLCVATFRLGPRLDRRSGVKLSYAADEPVYVEGDQAYSVYAVISGAVRTIRYSLEGRRQIGAFYYPGDLFGLEPGEDHRFSAEALCPTEVAAIPRGAALPDENALTQAALAELARAQDHLAMLGRRTACEKMASFLLETAVRARSNDASLPMSRQDMADYLGLAMETVSRVLGQFQNDGLVAFPTCRDFRILKTPALERLAAS